MIVDQPISKRWWEVLLGILTVGGVLISMSLVRQDVEKLLHLSERCYIASLVVGLAMVSVALVGIVALMVLRLLSRMTRPYTWCECVLPSQRDLQAVHDFMTRWFGNETPSITRMRDWHRRNKTVFTAIYMKELAHGAVAKTLVGVFKVLPLAQDAVALIESEQVTGANLTAEHLVKFGERAAGLYIGDVAAMNRRAKGEVVRRLRLIVQQYAANKVPIYTRPLTSDGVRLVRKYLFVPVLRGIASGTPGRIHKLSNISKTDSRIWGRT
jgi:hypothetical protein